MCQPTLVDLVYAFVPDRHVFQFALIPPAAVSSCPMEMEGLPFSAQARTPGCTYLGLFCQKHVKAVDVDASPDESTDHVRSSRTAALLGLQPKLL